MAKKKAESSAPAPKAPAKKDPAKKPAAKSAATPSELLINTSAAAAAAAALIGNKVNLAQTGGVPQSAAFKAMKDGLSKPAPGMAGSLLGSPAGQKKSNTPFGQGNQNVSRNQTFGADVNRAGVPRRTGGG